MKGGKATATPSEHLCGATRLHVADAIHPRWLAERGGVLSSRKQQSTWHGTHNMFQQRQDNVPQQRAARGMEHTTCSSNDKTTYPDPLLDDFIVGQTGTNVEHSNEEVNIIVGPEYVDLEGNTLIICKALYGLRSSGLRWHEGFSIALRAEGFVPCEAEPDIWMRDNGETYEHIGVYVDGMAANEIQKGTQLTMEIEDADPMRVPVGTIGIDMALGHLAYSAATIISSRGGPEERELLIQAFTGQLLIKVDVISRARDPT
jgi:hypothetical protein